MTRNQLQYWANREIERSNLAREHETNRANRRSEELRSAELNEQYRSNREREKENYRSNTARENEQNRANLANEALTGKRDTNTYRTESAKVGVERQKAATAAQNVSNQYALGMSNLAESRNKRLQDMEMGTRNIAANLAGSLLNAGVRLLTGGRR